MIMLEAEPGSSLDRAAALTLDKTYQLYKALRELRHGFVIDPAKVINYNPAKIEEKHRNAGIRYHGRETPEHVGSDNANMTSWLRLAAKLRKAGIPPDLFIRYQFLVIGPVDPIPPTPALLSDVAMKRYHDGERLAVFKVHNELRSDTRVFMSAINDLAKRNPGVSRFRICLYVLRNVEPGITLSPVFRYCALCSLLDEMAGTDEDPTDLEKLRASVFPAAVLQYCYLAEAYRRVWGKLIPTGFDAAAHRYFDDNYFSSGSAFRSKETAP